MGEEDDAQSPRISHDPVSDPGGRGGGRILRGAGIKGSDGKEQAPEKGTWTIVCTKVTGEWGIASLR